MSKSECDWYRVVPIHELRVNVQKIIRSEWSTRCVEDIKGCMNQLAKFAEALVYRSDIRWLLARPLKWRALTLCQHREA